MQPSVCDRWRGPSHQLATTETCLFCSPHHICPALTPTPSCPLTCCPAHFPARGGGGGGASVWGTHLDMRVSVRS